VVVLSTTTSTSREIENDLISSTDGSYKDDNEIDLTALINDSKSGASLSPSINYRSMRKSKQRRNVVKTYNQEQQQEQVQVKGK